MPSATFRIAQMDFVVTFRANNLNIVNCLVSKSLICQVMHMQFVERFLIRILRTTFADVKS